MPAVEVRRAQDKFLLGTPSAA